MGSFRQEIEAIVKSILPTDLASNKIDKRLITAAWDIIVGSSAGIVIKKSFTEFWSYLVTFSSGAWTKQQYANSISPAIVSSVVNFDALIHQDITLGSIAENLTMNLPINGVRGMYITMQLAATGSNRTLTWASGWTANEDGLPTTLEPDKWYVLTFRCVTPGVWLYMGQSRVA